MDARFQEFGRAVDNEQGTIVHVFFMAWTILNAHHPPLFIP
jgi:hypothetical protein